SVRRKLVECSARWGFPHAGLHNVGASVYGPSEMVRHFLVAQMDYCRRLLAEEFAEHEGQWPGWCKNVLTMYAGELALRQTYPQRCAMVSTVSARAKPVASPITRLKVSERRPLSITSSPPRLLTRIAPPMRHGK
uniref:DUF7164 domain-containing protein n=1 Tax=Burkholderia vietnamiensis TaxID=60552 RepID=UPI003C7A8D56